jgi:hypothetical protein
MTFDDLPFDVPAVRPATGKGTVCRHAKAHRTPLPEGGWMCRCTKVVTPEAVRRGKTVRSYGNRAELKASRLYGGEKIGHAGGPVDIRGADFDTQVRTKRRNPPAEWVKAINAMRDGTRVPRILLRFVRPGNTGPDDWFVFRASDFLDWFGRDEDANAA